MFRAYFAGARAAAQRWPLILLLWLILAAFGATFAAAAGIWLSDALEGSLATRTLFRTLDPDVFVDLWYHHREGLDMLLVMALVLAGIHVMLWWWLDGVVISALQHSGGERGPAWARGLELAPVMARLSVLALGLMALFSAAVGGAAWLGMRWTRSAPAALIWYEIGAGAALLWALGYVFLVAVHDHARLRAARTDAGALAAYRWALAFVLHGGERAFPLACALQLANLVLLVAYQAVGLSFPITAILGLTGSLLWGQAFLWIRLWLRVWFFAAQNEIQPL